MTITTTATAAAPRRGSLAPSTLSTPASPFALPVGVDSWRDRVPGVGVPTAMRAESAFRTYAPDHNSILSTVAVVPVQAGGNGVRTAKQAGPPRGVPR